MYAPVRGLALALALAACSSSGQGGTTGSAGGGGATGAGGQIGGGGAGGPAPVTLHITWSTWQLSGTTLMPVTCPMLGVGTVGYQFNGPTLETQDNEYSSGGSDCAAGEADFAWMHGPGTFSLLVGLWSSSFDANSTPALVAVRVSFTVPPAGGTVIVPEAKMIFARFSLVWTIEKGGAPIACADAGAQTVRFELVGDMSTTITFSRACADTTDTTPPLRPGTYTASATLVGNAGATLATWTTSSAVVITRDMAPPLPPITFTLP
jgi:hypothetical protein